MKKGQAELFVVLVIVGILIVLFMGIQAEEKKAISCKQQLVAKGINVKDVEVILKGTSYDLCDFLNSPTLQEKYTNKDLSFFAQAQNQKLVRDTKNAADGAMIMSTVAAVSAMSRPTTYQYHR